MSELTAAAYEPARQTGVLELLDTVWGTPTSAAEFDWWVEENPVGPRLVTVMLDGDKVVGVAAISFHRFLVDGAERKVAMPVHIATHPAYRGRGVFPRLEDANEERATDEGSVVGLTFPTAASHPIFVGRLGWQELWRGRIWARPPLPASRRGKLRVQALTAIPVEVERLRGSANGLVTDAAFLEWRYLRSPRPYRVLGAFEGESLRGLLAVRLRRGRLAVVCHALGDVAQLLRAVGSNGALATVAVVPPEQRRAFLRAGFVPTFKSARVLGKVLRPTGSLAGGWQFQLGDFDPF